MFTRKELQMVDTDYFLVIERTAFHIIIKSINTGHIWDLYSKENPHGTSIVVFHKHDDGAAFHEQPWMHPSSVIDAQEAIKSHDAWHLAGRKGKPAAR